MNPEGLPGLLLTIATRAEEAADPAVLAMAERYKKQLTQVTLRQFVHPPGMRTTSPPGMPPAYVTGELVRSIWVTPLGGRGATASAMVGPHTVYAAIQEWGGDIYPRTRKYLRWMTDGQVWYKKHVRLPERPYMQPALDVLLANGDLTGSAEQAFSVTVWGRNA